MESLHWESWNWFLIAPGALLLLGGWVLYWTSLNVAGAVVCGAAGLALSTLALPHLPLDATWRLVVQGAAALVGAVIGVLAFRFLHRAGFFVIGGVAGGIAGWIAVEAWRDAGGPEWLEHFAAQPGVSCVTAIVAGLLAVALSKYLIALATATLGAMLIVAGMDWPLDGIPAIPAAVLGFALQAGIGKRWHRLEETEEE